jgi:glutamine amidotransferase
MPAPEVTVIDYGVGNLLSVRRGLEHCGAVVTVSPDPDAILRAPRVVLPGVGAFANAIAELQRTGLVKAVQELATRGTPLLGICLGMQMLLDQSEEFGITQGLGLIAGRVVPVPAHAANGSAQKIPHIGWSPLVVSAGRADWRGTVMRDIEPGESVYFVHSFMADPIDPAHRVADCLYGGVSISATIQRDNIVGCQFHPEKSGEVGLRVLRSFLTT